MLLLLKEIILNKRGDKMIHKNECPVATTLSLISNKWKILILRELLKGTQRFGQLHRNVDGISQKVLTSNLREMEKDGILTRNIYPEVPPRVEYSLSDIGNSMRPIIDSMHRWGEDYLEKRECK